MINTMSSQELGWVAGLLEGEGCFSLHAKTSRTTGTIHGNIQVKCAMTDLDVLEKLRNTVGVGHLDGPRKNGSNNNKPYFKPIYFFRVTGADAYELMKMIVPLMGSRRSGIISGHIADYEATPIITYKIIHIESGKIEDVKSMREFCRVHRLRKSALQATLEHPNWRCGGYRRVS